MQHKKKLLLLGGSRYLLPVIKAAHDLGLYVITCDYLPDNYAHRFADEYCNVSIIDKDAVLKVAKEKQIDGILSFACDPGVVTAAYVAEEMGLPHSGSYRSVSILQNKGLFRKFLKENGFQVPTAKAYKTAEEALREVGLFHWPVIVKPADSAGSKGVTRVDDPALLEKSIRYALQFSHCNEFIVEDFLQKTGFSSDSDCFSVEGELKFVSFSAQRFDADAGNPYTPSSYSWPASISAKNQKVLAQEIQRLLKLLSMGTSIYNIETRECVDGKAYIMEVSPRGGGNRLAEMLQLATGVDLIGNTVRAAVGEPLEEIGQWNYDGCWAEIILHSNQAGVYDHLWIHPKIQNCVVQEDLWVKQGDPVGNFSGANEALGTLVLKFETEEQLQQVMQNSSNYVKVVLK